MFGKVFGPSSISKIITFLGLLILVLGFLTLAAPIPETQAMPVTPSCGDFSIPIGTTSGTSYDSSVSGNNLYIVNSNTNSLYVIDVTSNSLIATVPMANEPRAVVNLNGSAYVFTVGTNTMVEVDEATNTIVNTFPLAANFATEDIITYQDKIFISLFNSIQVFNTLTDTFETGSRPTSNYANFLGTINDKIYYSHSGNNNIQIIDYNTNAVNGTNINIGNLVSKGVLIGTDLFAIAQSSNAFREIDTVTDTMSDSFFLPGSVTDIIAVGTDLYIKGINNTTLYEMDTTNSNSINTVTTSGQGSEILYGENKLIVNNYFAGTKSDLIFLDNTTLEPRFTLPLPSSGGYYTHTIDYIDNKLYIGSQRNVAIVDLTNEELLQPCPPTTISPSNYGPVDCTPDPAEISNDTIYCVIDLVGDSENNYQLPGTGITANIIGLAPSNPCVINNNGTSLVRLACPSIPTTGGSPGSVDIQTDDTTVTQIIDSVTLENPGPLEVTPPIYGTVDCSPDPAQIGVDTITCLIDLNGSVINTYALPSYNITAFLLGTSNVSDNCDIINNGTSTAQLRCQNLPTTGTTAGSIDVYTDNDVFETNYIDTITLEEPPTVVSPSNYSSANCEPDPATIGDDTLTCRVQLTGSPNNSYQLPSGGITANLVGLGAGDACTIESVIIGEGTGYELVCTNIPTAGASAGNTDVQTDISSTLTTIDNIELVLNSSTDSDNDGVSDGQENTDGTDPNDPNDYQDSDGDLVPDEVEDDQGTDPFDPGDFLDDDNGGLPNYVESVLIPNNGGPALNTTDENDDEDPDNDSVSSNEEQLAFNSGDGNGDGIKDMIQGDVASRYNPLSDSYVTMQAFECTDVVSMNFVEESENSDQDDDYDYPYGLHRFVINCVNPGDTAIVKFYWGKSLDTSDWIYRKYDENTYFNFGDITIGQEQINNTSITTSMITVTDGGEFDVDGLANGQIVDPAGPALELITGNSTIDSLIRTGGRLASGYNYRIASILLFGAAGLCCYISFWNYSYGHTKNSRTL